MSDRINSFASHVSEDELVAGLAAELGRQDEAEVRVDASRKIATAAALIVRCAEELEQAGLDTAPADTALEFIEAELL